jgi:hypothetical protein
MFGTIRSPIREQMVAGFIKQTTAVDSYKARIPTSRVLGRLCHDSSSSA